MSSIVFVATSWGFEKGGINSFNHDICLAVGRSMAARRAGAVVCVVLRRTLAAAAQAALSNVQVLSLERHSGELEFADEDARAALELLAAHGVRDAAWFVGHDLNTGPVAREMRGLNGRGRLGVILHTNRSAYTVLKHEDAAEDSVRRRREQEALVSTADAAYAVGPKLLAYAKDLVATAGGANVPIELVPGLAEIKASPVSPASQLKVLTFGRLGLLDDRIKQARLAIASFAELRRRPSSVLKADSVLTVIGVPREETRALQRYAESVAGRRLVVQALPYQQQRSELFRELRMQSVALMLSVHEGFGLAGWESISAEVPLILSRNSGLYEFIDQQLGGAGVGCVLPVDVHGSSDEKPNEQDVQVVVSSLEEVLSRWPNARRNATALLTQIRSAGFTWTRAADTFLAGLGLDSAGSGAVVPVAAALHPSEPPRAGNKVRPRRQTVIGKAEVAKIRKFWKGRTDLFGAADAERDAVESADWFDELFVESPTIRKALSGEARIVVGRKGAGKSAMRIAASNTARASASVAAPMALSVLADEAFESRLADIGGSTAGLQSTGGWYKAFAHQMLRALVEDVTDGPIVQSVDDAIREWSRNTNFSERSFAQQVTAAGTSWLPPLLVSATPGIGTVLAQRLSRPINLYIDDFDKLYTPGRRERSVETIQSALEAADKLTLRGAGHAVTVLIREDLWLLCRGGWSYLDKVGDVVDLRWSESLLKDWTARRLRRAAAEALGLSVREVATSSFSSLWEIFFPPTMRLENEKESESFGYVLRRTLYTPRDIRRFCVRVAEVTRAWPARYEEIVEAEKLYSQDRLQYLVTEFESLCDGLSACLNSFATRAAMEFSASELYKHLKSLIASGEVRLVNSLVEGDSELSLARFLFRIGFLEVRYPENDRWEVRDALRYPDHWTGIRRDDSVKWAVRSTFYRVLESHRRETPLERIDRVLAEDRNRVDRADKEKKGERGGQKRGEV